MTTLDDSIAHGTGCACEKCPDYDGLPRRRSHWR